jgi:hypothetical protein
MKGPSYAEAGSLSIIRRGEMALSLPARLRYNRTEPLIQDVYGESL